MRRLKLKPCPFCGGKARIYFYKSSGWNITCNKCRINIHGYAFKDKLREHWNMRVNDKSELVNRWD